MTCGQRREERCKAMTLGGALRRTGQAGHRCPMKSLVAACLLAVCLVTPAVAQDSSRDWTEFEVFTNGFHTWLVSDAPARTLVHVRAPEWRTFFRERGGERV